MTTEEQENRIYDYLSGRLDKAEEEEFNRWLEQSDAHRKLFKARSREFFRLRWCAKWDALATFKGYSDLRLRLQRQRKQWMKYAATVALLLGVAAGIRVFTGEPDKAADPLPVADKSPRRIVDNVPLLTLGNGEQIALSAEPRNFPALAQVSITLTDSGRLEYNPTGDTAATVLSYNTLTVPKGCEFHLTLADGSQVWLNADSELKYPESFPPGDREVYLSGEAYFDVASDEAAPFKVRTAEMELKVLGTTFNVRAYGDEKRTTTTLVTGKIAQYYPAIQKEIVLTPLRQSMFDNQTGQLAIGEADLQEALAWKEGKIVARNQRLEDIFLQLSRWYDFETVYLRPELKDIRFHLHTKRYANVREILDHLQSTNGIRFSYADHKIYVSQ